MTINRPSLLSWGLVVAGGLACSGSKNPVLPPVTTTPPITQGGGQGGAVTVPVVPIDGGDMSIDGGGGVTFVPSLPAPPATPLAMGALGRLDPDEIYLLTGAIANPANPGQSRSLIYHWSQPDLAIGGIKGSVGTAPRAYVRRTDGRLLFAGWGSATSSYWFGADEAVAAPFSEREAYPDPERNDEAIVPPHNCVTPGNVFMSYAGRLIFECECPGDTCRWLDEDNTLLARSPSAPARYRTVLMDGENTLVGCAPSGMAYACELLTNASPASVPSTTKLEEDQPILSARALARGFIYVAGTHAKLNLKIWYPPETAGHLLGTYPPAPADLVSADYLLDGYGNAYYLADIYQKLNNVLYRATIGEVAPVKLLPDVIWGALRTF
jgi:hypothetical protein